MTSFSVRCFEGFNGGLPQSFLLEVRDPVSQALRANVTAAWPAFQVDRLEPGASYHAVVFSVNSKGRSDPVIVQASTVRPAEKQLHPDKGKKQQDAVWFSLAQEEARKQFDLLRINCGRLRTRNGLIYS